MTIPDTSLVITVHFLDGLFHGRRHGGEPEYPPSPLRVFQALVASAGRLSGPTMSTRIIEALAWLESLDAPAIVAPAAMRSTGYRLSVPNNAMDVVARAWSRGNDSNIGDANPATHRTMKPVRPHWLADSQTVYYVWQPPADVARHIDVLSDLAASIVAVGWGCDLAVGHASLKTTDEIKSLRGQWRKPAAATDDGGIRVPMPGTLNELLARHRDFLGRVTRTELAPPPALRVYRAMDYRRELDPPHLPVAAFSLLTPDLARWRPFDSARLGLTVAGRMRYATRRAAERAGWETARINAVVLGHAQDDGGLRRAARFAYLPLPSLEVRNADRPVVVGAIRRALVVSFEPACKPDVDWTSRALSGEDLIDESTGDVAAVLSLLPRSEAMVKRYTGHAATWTSVTPVVLPGHDDARQYRKRLRTGVSAAVQRDLLGRIDRRVDCLLRKAIVQAGLSPALADHALIDWRPTGFLPGVERVDRYGVPDHLRRFPRVHVRIEWRDGQGYPVSLPGPICLGGGRFAGIGLLAPHT